MKNRNNFSLESRSFKNATRSANLKACLDWWIIMNENASDSNTCKDLKSHNLLLASKVS